MCDGVLCYKIKDGAWNAEAFCEFIVECLAPAIVTKSISTPILIMDNCPFHKSLMVTQCLARNNILVRFLPTYSPQLNPIEEFFSMIKNRFQSLEPRPTTREEVKERIITVFNGINTDLKPFFNHMRNFLEKALAKQEF